MKINTLFFLFSAITNLSTAQNITVENKSEQSKETKAKLKEGQQAPQFEIVDVYGDTTKLSALRGKKILLSFYRYAGCPICNLRFHELSQQDSFFKANNVVRIAIYESTNKKILEYLNGEKVFPLMIADTSETLYNLYKCEKSTRKVFKSLFNGLLGKMKWGNKLFKTKIKRDGNMNRIEAEFLIDENGKISIAHYGRFVGDDLPVEQIKKEITN